MAHSITHVIFDVDGLLLDSERIYDTINAQIAQEYGRTFTQDVRRKIKGKKEAEVAQSLIEELDLPITVHDFLIKDREQQEILLPTVDLLPGAEKLVRHLHKQGIPIAIATGSSSRSMRLKTTRHKDLFSLFNHFVYSSDDPEVMNSKPAPDCFLLASSRFPDKPEPRKCLVFEDACNGLLAAHAAGMHCVWVPDQDQPQEGYREIATLTLESLLQFKPEQLDLPPYNV